MVDSEHLLPVKTKKGAGYIDRTGVLRVDLRFNECYPFSENLARVRIGDKNPWTMGCEYGKQGFVDRNGKEVIPAEYPRAACFSEGLAVAYVDSHYGGGGWAIPAPWEGGKAGYLDLSAKWAIEPRFDHADSFRDGIARVRSGDKWGFVNKRGDYIVEPQYDDAKPFHEGYAAVNVGKRSRKTTFRGGQVRVLHEKDFGRWGYLDAKGSVVIQPRFRAASSFSEGRAWVTEDDPAEDSNWQASRQRRRTARSLNEAFGRKERCPRIYDFLSNVMTLYTRFGYIDAEGRWRTRKKYRETHDFSQGLAAVYQGIRPKCGYIDANGTQIVKPRFDEGFSFSGSFARVERNARTGFIDTSGRLAIQPRFVEAGDFSEGLAAVRTSMLETWGYVDRDGALVIESRFSEAGPFQDGLAFVRVGAYDSDSWIFTYTNPDGEILWHP